MNTFFIIAASVVSLGLLVIVGKLLYKHFVTDQIKDKGGMMNPNYTPDTREDSVDDTTEEKKR